MAESEPQEENCDNMKKVEDLENLLENMEKLTVRVALVAYDMVAMRTNPDLTHSMKLLEDALLSCRGQLEKKWQEELMQ
ncbi:SYCE3 protein, partial [Climacteris rufus]|nr:SYCE3 protein [Climacteris rufus]